MKRHTLARVSLLFLFPAALHADPLADENARLRQQVQELQTRNAALERACPAAAQVAPSATPAAAAAVTTTAAAAPVAALAPAPPPPPPAPVVHQPLQFFGPAPAPPPGAAAAPPPPATPPDYATTGCDRGFFSGPARGKWENPKAWKTLHAGMSQGEVEALLGIEHYNEGEPKGAALHWQYGRCNSTYEGEVVFVDGKVSSYSAP